VKICLSATGSARNVPRSRLALAGLLAIVSVAVIAPMSSAQKANKDASGRYLPNGTPSPSAAPFFAASEEATTSTVAATTVAPSPGDTTPPTTPTTTVPPAPTTTVLNLAPAGKIFHLLIIGSDARPNERFDRTRSDSMHVLSWNPDTKRGSLMGIPRDTYVKMPNGKMGKITGALGQAGPEGVAAAVRNLTGIPVTRWVVTGFAGFKAMVDQLGGVTINVTTPMNDSYSGARFAGGWYNFNGAAALAFARNRHDTIAGDFTRSENQGKLLLAILTKLRAETSSPAEFLRWVEIFERNGKTSLTRAEMLSLALTARRIEPGSLANVVIPGKAGKAGGASVVFSLPTPMFDKIKRTGTP
jgi:polyisoprenyl-teichoic acid--peptidoglycan teichoic acid transferase